MKSTQHTVFLLIAIALSACSTPELGSSTQLSNVPTQHVGSELKFEGEPDPDREIIRSFEGAPPFYTEAFTSIEYLNHLGFIPHYGYYGQYEKKGKVAEMVLKTLGIEPDIFAYSDCVSDLDSASFALYFCHAVEQGWLEPYEQGLEEWQKEITEIEFLKLLFEAGFQEEMKQLTQDEIEQAVYDMKDVDPDDWEAPYLALVEKMNLDIDAYPYDLDWEDGVEILVRALLVKQEGWDFYHPYFRYEYLKEQGLEHLIDRQCYRTSPLEFDFLESYLESEYDLSPPSKHFGQYESIKNEPLPFFDSGYFCPLNEGGYLFSNSIALNRNVVESHLMEFDSDGRIVRDRSFLCDPFSSTGSRNFDMSPIENPDRFELLTCNYGRDDRRAYSFGEKLNDDPYSGSSISGSPMRTSEQLLDIDSFEALSAIYARDKDTIFCRGNDLHEADYDTFKVLNNNYAKDENQVYFQCNSYVGSAPEIHDADPETFEAAGEYHAKDKDYAYYRDYIISGVHLESFEVINNRYSVDKNNAYSNASIVYSADPKSFEVIGDSVFSKDKKHVYYLGYSGNTHLIEGADTETFQVLNHGYAKDKNSAFHYSIHSKGALEDVDIDTFEIMPAYGHLPFARDVNQVYCESTVVSDEPDSFDYEAMRLTCPFPYDGPPPGVSLF